MVEFYLNQSKAANMLMSKYASGLTTLILSAQCQAGKTGAVIDFSIKAIEYNKKRRESQTVVFVIGPSSTALKEQTSKRFKSHPILNTVLLKGETYHANDIYKDKEKLEGFLKLIADHVSLGHRVIVIHDEAHIGIGIDAKGNMMRIPQFFKDNFKGTPLRSALLENVCYVSVTATPYTYDTYLSAAGNLQDCEVHLDPGVGYHGIGEAIAHNRIQESFNTTIPEYDSSGKKITKTKKKQIKQEMLICFKDHLRDIIVALQNYLGYFAIRVTSRDFRTAALEVIRELGVKYEKFESKSSNIQKFEEELKNKPKEFKIMMINRSFKEGSTLCKENICGWYESNTWSKRSDADETQSLGRCWGYLNDVEGANLFPIWANLDTAYEVLDYYKASRRADYMGKRSMPLSSTHTKHKTVKIKNPQWIARDTEEEAKEEYRKIFPDTDISFSRRRARLNASYDVLGNLLDGKGRQTTNNRVNIDCVDESNPAYEDSFEKACKRWGKGKYIILYQGIKKKSHKTIDKSYLSVEDY